MNSYLRILETSKKDKLHKTLNLRKGDDSFSQWSAIRLTEEMADVLMKRLTGVLPDEVRVKVKNVKLNLQESGKLQSNLEVRAQFNETEHRQVLLKVFVHEVGHKGKTKKIAKAVYELEFENIRGREETLANYAISI